jgi:acyl-[acyl-carrier-protein]-phospholipid O-acyltransferase/long-chain-fatty-acid--[acyl-carrier-protein] ligase
MNTEEQDVVMATLPLFHAFGLTGTVLMPLVEGIPAVCHPDPTDVVNIAKAVAEYRGTVLLGTSTFFRLYVRNARIQPLMLQSLRLAVAGAEKLSTEVRESFRAKFGKDILEGYGSTETTPVASVNIPDQLDTTEWKVQIGSKPGTVGMPVPGASFRVVDPDTLQDLPLGEEGLVLIGGTQVMLGYLNDPERTAKAIVEEAGMRWYKSGDKGHLDADGFLTLVDRYSRFAKIAGEMVSLTAVEEQLCALNFPDPKKGERIVLLVASETLALDDLSRRLLESGMPPLSLPAEYRRVAAIPKLGSGKTDFGAARALALSLG